MPIQNVSAITLATRNMDAGVQFYQKLGFELGRRGKDPAFTTLYAGKVTLNLISADGHHGKWWGRIIFRVDDVDAYYQRLAAAGLDPDTHPQDAPWGERFFHITDPDGHELSFAKPLAEGEPS